MPAMLTTTLFLDPISTAAEARLGVEASPASLGTMLRQVARSIVNALARTSVLFLGYALLAPLWLIPGIGGGLWSAVSWIWSAFWLTAAYLDVPMARHLYSFGQEARVLWRRPWLSLGFGSAVALMLWVPLLNFFFIPVAVVGATLLMRGLIAAGELSEPRELEPRPQEKSF